MSCSKDVDETVLIGSDSDDVFSSRSSIDTMFHTSKKAVHDSVDVLLSGFDDGSVNLQIYDCFEIGTFHLGKNMKPLNHAYHPLSPTHSILALEEGRKEGSPLLSLTTLDLCFIPKAGQYLSLLASKSTQLQNLLRYVDQTQNQIRVEWKTAQELPSRWMRNLSEDLEEKSQCDATTALFHLLVTGNCYPVLKEFLVDQVAERV